MSIPPWKVPGKMGAPHHSAELSFRGPRPYQVARCPWCTRGHWATCHAVPCGAMRHDAIEKWDRANFTLKSKDQEETWKNLWLTPKPLSNSKKWQGPERIVSVYLRRIMRKFKQLQISIEFFGVPESNRQTVDIILSKMLGICVITFIYFYIM